MNNLCKLVDQGIFISPQGIVAPCCVGVDINFGNIYDKPLRDILDSPDRKRFIENFNNGILHDECNRCINIDNYGIRKTKSALIIKENKEGLVHADITLGNICKLSCTMCDSTFSHTWANIENRPHRIKSMTKEQVDEIVECLADVSDIELKGGDPFNMPFFNYFINKILDINPDVSCNMLSSCLHISEAHIKTIKRFKPNKIAIGISVEATGDLYKYIRGGDLGWETVLENIKRLRLSKVYISSILSLYNITTWTRDIQKIIDSLEEIGITVMNPISLNLVTAPSNQSVFNATIESRQKWYDENTLLPYVDTTEYEHILEDRITDATYFDIIREIEFSDNRRGFTLESCVPDYLDSINRRD